MRRLEVRVAIVLGRNGLKAADTLDRDIGVVAGGVLSLPESPARAFSVHSLAPDPGLLLASGHAADIHIPLNPIKSRKREKN